MSKTARRFSVFLAVIVAILLYINYFIVLAPSSLPRTWSPTIFGVDENGDASDSLIRAARAVVVGTTVPVAFTNSGYAELLHNLVCSIEQCCPHRSLLVLALSHGLCETTRGWPGVVCAEEGGEMLTTMAAGIEWYGSDKYFDLCTRRLVYLRALLRAGFDVLLSDTDIVWLRDPLSIQLVDAGNDAAFQSDCTVACTTAEECVRQCDGYERVFVNTGFFLMRSTTQSIALVDDVLRRGPFNSSSSDQEAMREAIRDDRAIASRFRFNMLDPMLFQNGGQFNGYHWPQKDTSVILHANFCHGQWECNGVDDKKKRFVANNVWFLVNDTCSAPS